MAARLVGVEVGSVIENYGLTELFSESSEPPFDVFPSNSSRSCSRG
jgi:hypothetical protein